MPQHQADTTLPPVGRGSTRTDLVAESIRLAIVEGRFPAGTTLVERRLAESLGVSKTPVREALIRLARSGLVEVGDNRQATVRQLGVDALLEVYDARLQLEPWAVQRAVELAAAEIPAAAGAALDDAESAMASDDRARMSLANRRFHNALYAPCGNELVRAFLDDLQDRVALGTVSLLWSRSSTWGDELKEHRRILTAARKGDPVAASDRLREHLLNARAKLLAGHEPRNSR
jgi:DNA-binding GntR family transcriptional regulator